MVAQCRHGARSVSLVGDLLAHVLDRRYRPWSKPAPTDRSIESLADELMGTRGELSGIALATQILDRFDTLDDAGKRAFFEHLAVRMDVNADRVERALHAYRAHPSADTYQRFHDASEPRRQEFLRRLNRVPGATGKLVAMRAELRRHKKDSDTIAALDVDFRHLFVSWFNRGFLVLQPINWDSAASVLQKIIAYEAVHAISSWDELRQRVEPADRRCFAFFHLSMPDEPLIFVEVALTQGTPGSIQSVLQPEREGVNPEQADTAVFYSISNCQRGLAGISFGNFLIKQVVADLSLEFPNLKRFVTLSPVPGQTSWVRHNNLQPDLTTAEQRRQLTAHYLLHAKRRDGKPVDPVARFHLGNGAILHAVHADADVSPKGQQQSSGTMVNYLYDLDRLASNHEAFVTQDKIACEDELVGLGAELPGTPPMAAEQ